MVARACSHVRVYTALDLAIKKGGLGRGSAIVVDHSRANQRACLLAYIAPSVWSIACSMLPAPESAATPYDTIKRTGSNAPGKLMKL